MTLDNNPLTQSRQILSSKLPEYRPFSLNEIVRVASIQGGAASPKMMKQPIHNVPQWLDIFLYCTMTIVIGAAVFMGLYSMWVKPFASYSNDPSQAEDEKSSLSLIQPKQISMISKSNVLPGVFSNSPPDSIFGIIALNLAITVFL